MNFIRFMSLLLVCQLGWSPICQGQIIDDIANQLIEPQDTFTTVDINDFILSGISCSNVTINPIIAGGTASPSVSCDGESNLVYQGNMTAYVKINFAGLINFNHKNDSIIAIAPDGSVLGCGKHPDNLYEIDQELFFINIAGDVKPTLVDIEIYSGAIKKHFRINEALTYELNARGVWNQPIEVDLSPLKADTSTNNHLKVDIADPDFRGEQCFEIIVSGCTPDNRGTTDKDTVCFTIIPDKFCEETYDLNTEIFTNQEFAAVSSIVTSSILQSSATVLMTAGESITLESGFHAKAGATFTARIAACELSSTNDLQTPEVMLLEEIAINSIALDNRPNSVESKSLKMKLVPNPVINEVDIQFFMPQQTAVVSLHLIDANGRYLKNISNLKNQQGWNQTKVSLGEFPAGVYFVALQTDKTILNKKLIKY